MLTMDPNKRATIEQIRKHRWMAPLVQHNLTQEVKSVINKSEPQQQILKLMHNLGIDSNRTVQVHY